MSPHRAFACAVVATSLVAAAEVRASCIDSSSCLCPSSASFNTAFAGTIESVAPEEGVNSGNVFISVRLDTVALAGTSTDLVVGSTVSLHTLVEASDDVREGVRVIGVSNKACEDALTECDPAAAERVSIVKFAINTSSIACNGTVLRASPETLAKLMAGTSCSSEIDRLLEQAGADTGCCDVGPCVAKPGPIPSTGWAGLAGIAALIGRRLLRRRSVLAS